MICSDPAEDASLGSYHALVGARIPFEMVYDQLLDADHVSQYRTLILPNIACLSDAHTRRIINGTHQVHATTAGTSIVTPSLIEPAYPDLPMEEVFPRANAVHDPGVYLREEGKGRVAYFPADIDRTFWDVLAGDHAMLLRNAVLWASHEPTPLEMQGIGVLDVALWSQRNESARPRMIRSLAVGFSMPKEISLERVS